MKPAPKKAAPAKAAPAAAKAGKWVFTFGDGKAEGRTEMRDLLGGKGANLAEMANLGLPVPPGFTITTAVCTYFYAHDKSYPKELQAQVEKALDHVGKMTGKMFGDVKNPLLVSVRSGARASMPGMMDTVLNLGLNDETVEALAELSGDRRFAYDSYRRFIKMYSDVVLGFEHHHFEEILDTFKDSQGYTLDTDLTAEDWVELVGSYKDAVARETGKDFPQDPHDQLWGAIGAVFSSWMNARAVTYRRLHDIPESWGTAVNVQAMVFGNMGETSATGVAFTRNPSTGESKLYGEFLINAQGEDVVAGIRTPQDITEDARKESGSDKPSMEEAMPEAFKELTRIYTLLEKHYRDMQDMEFTVEQGKLWMLQTRSGKRTAKAALSIAVELANEGLIIEEGGGDAVDPASLDQLLHPTIDPDAKRDVIATGLPASPGAASGEIVFSSDEAAKLQADGRKVILVRIETSPEDIHGMHAAEGILTTRGGMTSHAAVVARGMGKPCVSGGGTIRVDYGRGTMSIGGRTFKTGDVITIDGSHRPGARRPHADDRAGAVRRVRHADGLGRRGPQDRRARQRRHAGGCAHRDQVRRRRHRPVPHRAHVLRGDAHPRGARDDPRRGRAGAPRRAGQAAADAARRLRRAVRDHEGPAGHDPPARSAAARIPAAHRGRDRGSGARHERRPAAPGRPCARALGVQSDARLPRLPHRDRLSGDRRDAGARDLRGRGRGREAHRQGRRPRGDGAADRDQGGARPRQGAHRCHREGGDARHRHQDRLPGRHHDRAAARRLLAAEIAESAEFFSFGTNDLTQTTFGISRDDAASFLGTYVSKGILPVDPFVSLDQEGVGELVKIGVERGRKTRPKLKVGICGEHGGDPASVAFCHDIGLDYVSCSPYRVPIARLAAAQAALGKAIASQA